MDVVPVYTAPAFVDSSATLSLYVRAVQMLNQLNPLPSVFVLALTDAQWHDIYGNLPADVARYPIQYADSLTVVIPWDTKVTLEPGLTWELAAIKQGWLYTDPPNVFDPHKIPRGPQYGLAPSQPNFATADALFMSGSWLWLLYA